MSEKKLPTPIPYPPVEPPAPRENPPIPTP